MNKITIIIGEYPHDCGLKKEPIEWIVLREEYHCLCMSKYLLDCKPYHDFSKNITWQSSALRSWLYHEFLMTAFSAEEREKIVPSPVENPTGNTQDYIFLLSADEVEDYVAYEERRAFTTAYARAQGVEETDCSIRPAFWLRTS